MAVKRCEHKYFRYVAGKLLCVTCNEPPEKLRVQTKNAVSRRAS